MPPSIITIDDRARSFRQEEWGDSAGGRPVFLMQELIPEIIALVVEKKGETGGRDTIDYQNR
jgi:hypothetical protein